MTRFPLRWWHLAAAVAVVACKCGPQVHAAQAQIEIDDTKVDFGGVRVNTSATKTIIVKSVTQQDLTISGTSIVGADAPAYAVVQAPTSVPGLGQATITLKFSPSQVRTYNNATLQVQSDDYRPAFQTVSVALAGQGGLPQVLLTPGCTQLCVPGDCCGGATCGDGGTCTANQCSPCSTATNPNCGQPARCATASPPAIDYGLEPVCRSSEPSPEHWPSVKITNAGMVPLQVSGFTITGTDAAQFHVAQQSQAVTFAPGLGEIVNIEFSPCGFDAQGALVPCSTCPKTSFSATFEVDSDDPANPKATLPLTGACKPKQPPNVCASVVQYQLPDQSQPTKPPWKTPVPVTPFTLLTLSGESDYNNPGGPDPNSLTACTTDPIDGRAALTWQWTVTTQPPQSRSALVPSASDPATVTFRPDAVGAYVLQLTATDPCGPSCQSDTDCAPPATCAAGHCGFSGSDTVSFVAVPQNDMAVQLVWSAPNVDLDLHLVKPGTSNCPGPSTLSCPGLMGTGAPCAPFDQCCDSSAFLYNYCGGTPDWGYAPAPGGGGIGDPFDDPAIPVDPGGKWHDALGDSSTGSIENVSLNSPQHDPACQTSTLGSGSCLYQVWVNFHSDNRTLASPVACSGAGCAEGLPCNCPQTNPSDAGLAPDAGIPSTGATVCVSNQCRDAPTAALQIYLCPTVTSACPVVLSPPDGGPFLQIPLPTNPSGAIALPGPCFTWHAADIEWPSPAELLQTPPKQPTATAVSPGGQPEFAYYGELVSTNPFACEGNTLPPNPWYVLNPDGGPLYP